MYIDMYTCSRIPLVQYDLPCTRKPKGVRLHHLIIGRTAEPPDGEHKTCW